ncbi:MAG TPA: MMPL family transporter [Mycobacteriales bacterium]|nr:MMPL family transporter [Mycobacteriales bacterium]
MTRLLHRLGRACAAHPLVVIAAWLVLAAIATTTAVFFGGGYSQGRSLPGTEVAAADDRLAAHFPSAGAESADVLLRGADHARVRVALPAARSRIERLPHVVPSSLSDVRWSADGRTAWLHVQYDVARFTVLSTSDLDRIERAARTSGLQTAVAGQLRTDVSTPGSGLGEKVGIAVAVLVLLIAFGSVIAALMPVATAALAIVTGLSLVKLLASVYSISDSAPALATMLGLGAGIDYALFIVTRHREGMRSGLEPADAAAAATSSAGSSVLWAGVTVVMAICGLVFAGIPLVTSLGFAAAIVVAITVVAALTLLPALLSLTDRHIDHLHIPLPHLRHERVHARPDPVSLGGGPLDPSLPVRAPTGWARWARAVERRPVLYVVGCTALLVVLAIPVSGMRLGMPDGSSAPAGSETRRAYTLMTDSFGAGANGPLVVVAELPAPAAAAAVAARVRAAASADRDVAAVGPGARSPDGTTEVVTIVPRSSPQSAQTAALVPRLREQVLPPVAQATGARLLLTGMPAGRYDVGQRVIDRLPWFVGAVLAVSFLLLMLVFRSVLVPLKAVLLNLLSIAAALGVVTAVFTWGWLRQLFGVAETVPLVDVVPMMMFAIVFGLSMDYEVFLLSRVREEWVIGRDSRGSVVRGLTSTARVISAAASIMVAVFLAFTLASDVIVKMVGLGLAVAVFLDATVIRLVLVPATMALLGDLNWWLPRWLDRLLPHVDVEAAVPVTPAELVPGPAPMTPTG